MLAPKKFSVKSTNSMLMEACINSAKTEEHIKLVHKWFTTNQITNLKGEPIIGLEF